MRTRRRALLPLLALLALLVAFAGPAASAGAPGASGSAAVHAALPALVPAGRLVGSGPSSHPEQAASHLDAVPSRPTRVPAPGRATPSTAAADLPTYLPRAGTRVRGPPGS